MDCFIISAHTQVTALEVKELISKKVESHKQVCVVRNISVKDLSILSYHCQSALRVCVLIGEAKKVADLKFSHQDLFTDKSFGVEHIKAQESETASPSFAGEIGGLLQDATGSKVNLSRPDIKVISCNDENIFVGIDVVGFDMSKRPYKLMAYPGSLNGVFAYVLLRLAGVDKKTKTIVDPFCGSATIPIEAALFQKQISPFQFSKKLLGHNFFGDEFTSLPALEKDIHVSGFDHQVKVMLAAQKNAKIAGVHDSITISKVAIDWIDAKFDEHTVDIIVTNPPKVNKRTHNEKQIGKLYDELFYQAKYILKKKATISLLLNREEMIQKVAKNQKFKHLSTESIHSGKQEYFFMTFQAP